MHNPQTVANVIKNTAQNKGVSVAQMLRDCGINKDLISTTQSKGYYPRVDALAAIAPEIQFIIPEYNKWIEL